MLPLLILSKSPSNQKNHSQFWIYLSYLQEAGYNNEEVKPIEQTLEIEPRSQGKYFQQQFQSEEGDKDNIGSILHKKIKSKNKNEMGDDLEACKPDWLAIVFRCKDTAVEEDKKKDDPKHGLCLDCSEAPLLCRFYCP